MKVKKISAANVEACSLPKLFDEEKIDFQPIQCVNWAEYPYKPKVNFRIAHTQDSILLHFKVKEESIRARYGEDMLNLSFIKRNRPVRGIITDWSRNLECPRKFCIYAYFFGCIQIFSEFSFYALFRKV